MNETFAQNQIDPFDGKAFVITTTDSISITVFARQDSTDLLSHYSARIISPVCDNEKCYDAELNMYWDLTGSFENFQTIPEKPLTKFNHQAFGEDDYRQLLQVIKNDHPSFMYLDRKDLVKRVVNDSLDGLSGATVTAIKNEVVPGAAYTCYTLWHIAHGAVQDSIRKYTRMHLNTALITKLASPSNRDYQNFLIEIIRKEDYIDNQEAILTMITHSEGYQAKRIIEKMPGSLLGDSSIQAFFSDHYHKLDYYSRLSLLKQLSGIKISNEFLRVLMENKTKHSSLLNAYVDQLAAINKE